LLKILKTISELNKKVRIKKEDTKKYQKEKQKKAGIKKEHTKK